MNGSGGLKRGPVHVRQGGPLRACNSHYFVSNMFWLLDGEDGTKGRGFKCDKEAVNKIMEVLRMERRKTYGGADNDIDGGGGVGGVWTENEGEIEKKRIEGVCVVFLVQVVVDCRAQEAYRCFRAVGWHQGKSV